MAREASEIWEHEKQLGMSSRDSDEGEIERIGVLIKEDSRSGRKKKGKNKKEKRRSNQTSK